MKRNERERKKDIRVKIYLIFLIRLMKENTLYMKYMK